MTEETTIKNKTMKVQEEIKPTNAPRQIERQKPGFTPGPWRFEEMATPDHHGVFGSDGSVAIAEILGFPFRKDAQFRANARLIAAAPALYEALKDSADAVHKVGAYHNPQSVTFDQCSRPICVKARAALSLVATNTTEEVE